MLRVLALLLAVALFGAAPTVADYGTNATAATSTTTVSMHSGNAPYTTCSASGCELMALAYGTATPALSGTWTTVCSGTDYGVYERAVTSSDTSATVTVTTTDEYGIALYLISGYTAIDADACSTSAPISATATYSGDLGLEFGAGHETSASGNLTWTQCSGYTNDSFTQGYSSETHLANGAAADHKTGLSSGTNSCSPSMNGATTAALGLVLLPTSTSQVQSYFGIWR